MSEAQGKRSAVSAAVNRYMACLQRAAQRDPRLSLEFHRVANLLAPPRSLLRPIAWRVLLDLAAADRPPDAGLGEFQAG